MSFGGIKRRLTRKISLHKVYERGNVRVETWKVKRRTAYRPGRKQKYFRYFIVLCFANGVLVEYRPLRPRKLHPYPITPTMQTRMETYGEHYLEATWDGWGQGDRTDEDRRLSRFIEAEMKATEIAMSKVPARSRIIEVMSEIEGWRKDPTQSEYLKLDKRARFD